MAAGFCVRALFGIAMGSLHGNRAATAPEDAPRGAQGILSGMLQQSHAFGYLLAIVSSRGLVNTPLHWRRPRFRFREYLLLLVILLRLYLLETNSFLERQGMRRERHEGVGDI
ncbi:hypothetical protein HOY80DRAFT_1098084 [Tuber brumale]|nr:hypothetical protein HOY80DRAFT_1098084 [Tuber brumale]